MSSKATPSATYLAVSIFLLIWGIGGASIYVAYFTKTPQDFALAAETSANRDAYAEYVANLPFWAIGAGIIAALARLFGAIGLLLRRAWALPLYVVSLGFFCVALFRAFVLANVASIMSVGHVATEIVFVALTIFAISFSYAQRTNGVLR